MTFLPIVDRELRVASRKRSTYWARAAMGLAAIALAVLLQLDASSMPAGYLGKRLFGGLMWIAFAYCLLAGRRSTADCLSSEKREGTLGLLFLTDLKGYDVVLGKLAATSLNGFYGLLAVLPVMAIPLLLGGVTSGEFWRVVLVLVLTFLLSLAAGIVVSAFSRDSRKALGANLLLLLGIMGIPPAIAAVIAYRWPAQQSFLAPLFYACPVYTIHIAEGGMYGMAKWHFWASAAVIQAVTWAMLLLASMVVPRSWQDKAIINPQASGRTSPGPWARFRRGFWRNRSYLTLEQRAACRRPLLEKGAYYWLASRGRLKRAQVWALFALVAGWWLWSQLKYGRSWQNDVLNPLNVITAVMINSALKVWICIEAGRQLAEDRRSGAFELLLSTSLHPREILQGQWRALVRQFFWPLMLAVAAEVMFLFQGLNRVPSSQEPSSMVTILWLAGMVIFMADVVALAQVSMWAALTSRTANRATMGALVRILVIPWIVLWGVSVLNVSFAGPAGKRPEWTFYLGLWFWSGIAADMFFGLIARFQLRERFRELAGGGLRHRFPLA